jgi:hypothetical protein
MDSTKQAAGPAMIAGGAVLLAALIYLIYHFTFANPANNVRKDNAPGYAKQSGMTDNPGGARVNPGGTPGVPGVSQSHRPQYGQGAGYAAGAGSDSRNAPPHN